MLSSCSERQSACPNSASPLSLSDDGPLSLPFLADFMLGNIHIHPPSWDFPQFSNWKALSLSPISSSVSLRLSDSPTLDLQKGLFVGSSEVVAVRQRGSTTSGMVMPLASGDILLCLASYRPS